MQILDLTLHLFQGTYHWTPDRREVFVVKLREREGQGVDQEGHSKVIYGWWMVDGGIPFPDALH